jgi:hypothetical protein
MDGAPRTWVNRLPLMVLAVRAAGFLFVAAQLAAGKLGSVTFASRLVPLAETGVLPPPRPGSAPDSGSPDMAAPAAREETAAPRGSG